MPSRPDGRITEIITSNRYTKNFRKHELAAIVVFPNGTRIIKPLQDFPKPKEVAIGMVLRWDSLFGGPFRLLPPGSERPLLENP